jgi:hypothetical protein
MRVECPSGMVVEMRPWSLADMGNMAIRAESATADDDTLILDAVSRQHVATIDPGPYPSILVGDAHFDWKGVLKADVLWGLYRVRAGSFPSDPDHGLTGEDYTFEHRCPNPQCDGHKTPSVQRVRLCDLRVRKLPATSAEVMKSGRSFELTVAGRLVKYQLPTFAIDGPLRAYLKKVRKTEKNPKRPLTPAEMLASQVTYIEGVNGSEADLASRARWLGTLTAFDWLPIRDAIAKAAPFIDNKVNSVCDTCRGVTTTGLPLLEAFWVPPDRSEELLDAEEEAEAKSNATMETSVEQ